MRQVLLLTLALCISPPLAAQESVEWVKEYPKTLEELLQFSAEAQQDYIRGLQFVHRNKFQSGVLREDKKRTDKYCHVAGHTFPCASYHLYQNSTYCPGDSKFYFCNPLVYGTNSDGSLGCIHVSQSRDSLACSKNLGHGSKTVAQQIRTVAKSGSPQTQQALKQSVQASGVHLTQYIEKGNCLADASCLHLQNTAGAIQESQAEAAAQKAKERQSREQQQEEKDDGKDKVSQAAPDKKSEEADGEAVLPPRPGRKPKEVTSSKEPTPHPQRTPKEFSETQTATTPQTSQPAAQSRPPANNPPAKPTATSKETYKHPPECVPGMLMDPVWLKGVSHTIRSKPKNLSPQAQQIYSKIVSSQKSSVLTEQQVQDWLCKSSPGKAPTAALEALEALQNHVEVQKLDSSYRAHLSQRVRNLRLCLAKAKTGAFRSSKNGMRAVVVKEPSVSCLKLYEGQKVKRKMCTQTSYVSNLLYYKMNLSPCQVKWVDQTGGKSPTPLTPTKSTQ